VCVSDRDHNGERQVEKGNDRCWDGTGKRLKKGIWGGNYWDACQKVLDGGEFSLYVKGSLGEVLTEFVSEGGT